ncbi:MAG: hypothetical protein EZS28_021387, partial [Streblomastix strix]
YYGNKGIVLPYQTYEKTIGPQLTLNQELKDNKDYKRVREQSLAKRNELLANSRQQSYAPLMDLIGRNKDIQFKKMWSNQPSFEEWNDNGKCKRITELGKANANYEVRTQAQTIARLVAATEAATTPSRIRSAFRRAANTSELVDGRYVARIDEAEYKARVAELFPGELHQN